MQILIAFLSQMNLCTTLKARSWNMKVLNSVMIEMNNLVFYAN